MLSYSQVISYSLDMHRLGFWDSIIWTRGYRTQTKKSLLVQNHTWLLVSSTLSFQNQSIFAGMVRSLAFYEIIEVFKSKLSILLKLWALYHVSPCIMYPRVPIHVLWLMMKTWNTVEGGYIQTRFSAWRTRQRKKLRSKTNVGVGAPR